MQIVSETRDLSPEATLKRIQAYIKNPPETSRIFVITPETAQEILVGYNRGNRPKKPGHIDRYADHMTAGTWGLTGDTLKFSDANILRDGQNRLMACVRAGVPFMTHVVFGIADELFAIMDQGKNRDGSDVLATAGYQNTSTLAGAVRWATLLRTDPKSRVTIPPPEVLDLLRNQFEIRLMEECVQFGNQTYDRHRYPRGLAAGALYVFAEANRRAMMEFATGWTAGMIGGQFLPIGNMHKRLAELHQASNGRVHDVVRAAYLVIAWNLFVQGLRGSKKSFEWVPTDEFPEILTR
jgi:hypothetical protein